MTLLAQDERLTRRVGAVALVVIAAATGFFLFVADRIEWGDHVRIEVYFHHVAGLREGADFVVAGETIGDVETIARSPRGAADTPLAGEEGVVATVAIESAMARRVMRGGDIFVAARGVFGERYLEIGPSPVPTATLAEGSERDNRFLGHDPPTLDRALQQAWDNLETAREFREAIRPEVDALRARLAELGATLDGLAPDVGGIAGLVIEARGAITEAERTRDVGLGGDAGLDRIGDALAQARATIARARAMLALLGARARVLGEGVDGVRGRLATRGPAAARAIEDTIDRVRDALGKIDPLLAKLEELNDRLARGEGSLGRLSRDPEFPEEAKELGKILKRQPWKIIGRPKD
jgi:ABC-type transporter Mla subunit MlaD